ncbi:MAG TPA: hypothetical protein DCZ43_03395, partial [candidate division Zixibacteria bacterium]|nr:hypothetical protein [candidate division Zixibacteria bacterium]
MKFPQILPKLLSNPQTKHAISAGIVILLFLNIFMISENNIALGQCSYTVGDVNNYQGPTALADVIYLIRYFRGFDVPPIDCGTPTGPCPQEASYYAGADVNGSCSVNGIDVTYMIGYYKLYRLPFTPCPSCLPLLVLKNNGDQIIINPDTPAEMLSDPTPNLDEIWLGDPSGTDIEVELGEVVSIPVWVKNDENVSGVTMTFEIDNRYLTPGGGAFFDTLGSWWECNYLAPEVNHPTTNKTTQAILGYSDLNGAYYYPYLNTSLVDNNYHQVASFNVRVIPDPSHIDQFTDIVFGEASRIGPTAFCDEFGGTEWAPECHPVRLNIHASTHSFIAGRVFSDNDDDCTQDQDEIGLPNWTVILDPDGISATTDLSGDYMFIDLPEGLYNVREDLKANWEMTCPDPPGVHSINLPAGGQIYETNFGNRATLIAGKVFYDLNGDGTQNEGEDNLRNWTVNLIPGPHSTVTDIDGNYVFPFLSADNYFVSLELQPNWELTYPDPPGTHFVSLSLGQQVYDLKFGARPRGPILDLSCDVGGTPARPGFYKVYGVKYRNKGDLTADATVTLVLPGQVEYSTCTPFCRCVPDCQFESPNTLSWDLTGLLQGETGWLRAMVLVPSTVDPGISLSSTAEIIPAVGDDAYPIDNISEETQEVRSSYDPNEKLVSPEGIIERTDTLTYQINFQNVGTAEAINVVVKDTLDSNLNISSFVSGASIHSYTYAILGREITWTFTNIMLPDSTTDEPGSHGFVRFTAIPISSVPAGAYIENRASIFFDFNPAVITNTVTNQIANHSSCNYTVGDANNSNTFTGLDIVYSVRYFKGGPAPEFSCDCPPLGTWFVAGDVNGSCSF